MRRYEYVVVRCVPDPRTGEFVNMGAIAWSIESDEWAVRSFEVTKHIKTRTDSASRNAVQAFLDRVSESVSTAQRPGSGQVTIRDTSWFEAMSAYSRNVVQIGETMAVLADTAERALDLVSARLVVDDQRHAAGITKPAIVKPVGDGYQAANVPYDTLERIEAFRLYDDGWYDNHRGIGSAVADIATELARLVGPDLVFAAPFDGAIVLTRRWPGQLDPHGRSVEVQPDGLMSLVADFQREDGVESDYDQPLNLGKAAAWLLADTRSQHAQHAGSASSHDPLCPVSRVRCISEDGHEYAVDGDRECFCPRPGCCEVYGCCPVIARVRDDQDERWERTPYVTKVSETARRRGLREAIDAIEDPALAREIGEPAQARAAAVVRALDPALAEYHGHLSAALSAPDLLAADTLASMLGKGSGLVVVAGPTGSGKSTLIDQYGAGSPERPLPTMEHAAAAVSDAEAGHLVLGTLYTSGPLATIERLVLMVPEAHQERWRLRLADALAGVVCTRLRWIDDDSVPPRRVAAPERDAVPWTPQLADMLRADDWAERLRATLGEA